jgi:hypothetical protein
VSAVFASVGEALAADVKAPQLRVTVGGRAVRCVEASTSHGVRQPIGTCSFVISAPVPSYVTLNTAVTVQMGYPGVTLIVFDGHIPNHAAAIDEQGRWATINAVGPASRLDYPDFADLRFIGPMSLSRIFRGLCARRGVPAFHSDEVLSILGNVIELGGVDEIDGGDVVIPRNTSPLQWLTQKAALFGYAVFDTPRGYVVLRRVSGLPSDVAVASYHERVNAYRFARNTDTGSQITYWEVKGATYTRASDGRTIAVRSIPDSVPYRRGARPARLPQGHHPGREPGEHWAREGLPASPRDRPLGADRNHHLGSGRRPRAAARRCGRGPLVQCGVSGTRWLMSINQSVSDTGGYYAQMEGWAGAGSRLPTGDDCVSMRVGSGSYHVGNNTLGYFADPTPDGVFLTPSDPVRTVKIAFTVPDEYSSLAFEARAHSTNDHLSGTDDTNSTWSTWEVWQRPDPSLGEDPDTNALRRVGSGKLPFLTNPPDPDFLHNQTQWSDIVIPVTGSLAAGDAELRLLSGHNPSGDVYDDYEVKEISLVLCGVGVPDLPQEGAS